MKPLFVFTADCHLEPYVWKNHPDLAGDAYHAFRQIVDYTIENEAEALLLGGDVLNVSTPDPKTVGFLAQQMERLKQAGIPCLFIVGQHEKHRLAQWLDVHDWPRHLDGEAVAVGRWQLYGISYQPRAQLPAAIAAIPGDVDLVMMHQVWAELHGDMMNPEASFADLPEHVSTVLTGDYHATSCEMRGGKLVVSPGSIAMQAIDEAPDKFFYVAYDTASGLRFEEEELETRRFQHVTIPDAEALEQFIEDVPHIRAQLSGASAPVDKPIIRVSFGAEIPDAFTRLSAALRETCHFFPNPLRSRQTVEVRQVTRRSTGPQGLLANLSRVLPEGSDEYAGARTLLECQGQDAGALEAALDQLEDDFNSRYRSPRRRSRRPRSGNEVPSR